MVISLAIDPFAQQLLTFRPGRSSFPPAQARFQQVTNLTVIPDFGSRLLFTGDSFFSSIAKPHCQGIYSGPREPLTTCSSGNCTWPTFHSLSWRTQCRNITTSVVLNGCDLAFAPDASVKANSNFCRVSTGPNDPSTTFATHRQTVNGTIQITGPEYLVWPTVHFNWAESSAHAADRTVCSATNNFMSLFQVLFSYDDSEMTSRTFTGPQAVSATDCSLVSCFQEYGMPMSFQQARHEDSEYHVGQLPCPSLATVRNQELHHRFGSR